MINAQSNTQCIMGNLQGLCFMAVVVSVVAN